MKLILCPYCEQSDMWRVSIEGVGNDLVMCGECDTVWKREESIAYGFGKCYEEFMAACGLEADWKRIQWQRVIEPDEL